MKRITKIFILMTFIIAIGGSFLAGSYIKEKEHIDSRVQRCNRLISFAIDKVENRDLSDNGVMEALISDIYAAHEFCNNPDLSAQLNDLWNSLICKGDSYIGREDELVTQLRNIAEML